MDDERPRREITPDGANAELLELLESDDEDGEEPEAAPGPMSPEELKRLERELFGDLMDDEETRRTWQARIEELDGG
jgi:hypothetical protein